MNPRNVLIVDDHKHNLAALRDSVRKLGHRVTTADQWRQGLAKARTERPDVVILDVMLPELNVPEFCNILKSYTVTRTIPIMLVGPKASSDTFIMGNVAHAEFYVVDNFNPTDLAADLYFLFEWKFQVPEENLPMLRLIQPVRFDIRQKRAMKQDAVEKVEAIVVAEAPRVDVLDNAPDLQTLAKMVNNLSNRLDALISVLERHDVIRRGEIDQKYDEIQAVSDKEVNWI